MIRRVRGRRVVLGTVVLAWAGTSARAQEATPPPDVSRIVGVPLGASRAEALRVAGELGVSCAPPPGRDEVLRCPGSLAISPVPAALTMYFVGGMLDRAFEAANLASNDFADWEKALAYFHDRLLRTLGPPTVPATPPEPWFRQLDGRRQLEALRGGSVRFSAEWNRPGLLARVWLSGEGGQPKLEIAVYTQAPSCDQRRTAELLLDLFPPSPPEKRAASAAALAACRVTRAAGAVAAALAHDAEPEVKIDAARALGRFDTPESRKALDAAARGAEPAAVRGQALLSLARLGETDAARDIVADRSESGAVKADALRALAAAGEEPPGDELARLATRRPGEPGAVADAAEEIRARQRSVAATVRRRETVAAASPFKRAPAAGERATASRFKPAPAVDRPATPAAPATPGPSPARTARAAAPAARGEPTAVAAAGEPAAPETEPGVEANAEESPAPGPGEGAAPARRATDAETPASAVAATPAPSPPLRLREPTMQKPPARPWRDINGAPMAVASSTVAGSFLFPFLVKMARLDSVSTLLLAGSAGAVIGAGTAWGLDRLGFHPTLEQSLWYTNATAWGTLAGFAFYQGFVDADLLGSDAKREFGALVVGESLGLVAGVAGAIHWRWTPQQTVLADTLVIGGGLLGFGVQRMRGGAPHVTLLAGSLAVPWMVGSAAAARFIAPTDADLHLIAAGALAGSLTGGLLAGGLAGHALFGSVEGQGGFAAGLGGGYVLATLAAGAVDVSPRRTWVSSAGLLAGDALGLGLHMAIAPEDREHWAAGAGFGGLALAAGTFAWYPHAQLGPEAPSMTAAGALYGASTWWLALNAGHRPDEVVTPERTARLEGGMLAGAVAAGTAGLVASRWYHPTLADELTVTGFWGLGMSAGLGVANLAAPDKGTADRVGMLVGAGAGFASGAALAHRTELRAPEVGAGLVGAGYGALLGALAPSLGEHGWAFDRTTAGALWLGLPAGSVGGMVLARTLHASGAQVAVPAVAGVFGAGMGAGAGLMLPGDASQPVRIGVAAGTGTLLAASMLVEPKLRLADGLGPEAGGLAAEGALLGAGYGLMLAGLVDPSGLVADTPARQLDGGVLMGVSAGAASGLVLSKLVHPSAGDYFVAAGESVLGGAAGLGIAHLAAPDGTGWHDTFGTLVGSMSGLVGGALTAHAVRLDGTDVAAGAAGLGYGALVGVLVPSLAQPTWPGDRRDSGGALVGLAAGAAGATAAAHLTQASPGQVAVPTVAGALGFTMGAGFGGLLPTRDTQATRIGAVSGTGALAAASILVDGKLHLSSGLGDAAAPLGLWGASLGSLYGLMLAGAVDGSGLVSQTPSAQLRGGALFGASLGVTSGLVLSKRFDPAGGDYVTAASASLAGFSFGLGAAMLVTDETGRIDTVSALSGSLAGLAGGAWVAHRTTLRTPDAAAGIVGAGYGALIGTLVPSLAGATWDGGRRAGGGALVGVAGLGVGGAAASHVLDASSAQVTVPTLAGAFGAGIGLGAGLLAPGDSLQPARVGTVAGMSGLIAASIAAEPRLRLADGAGATAGGFATLGSAVGVTEGVLLAGALDDAGLVSQTPARQAWGGALLGLSAGSATGIVASKFHDLTGDGAAVAGGGFVAGGALGLGVTMLATPQTGRPDTLATMAGSIVGLGGATLTELRSPLEEADGMAMPVGLGYGALLGSLAPSLLDSDFAGWTRRSTGGLVAGASGGALAAVAWRHGADAEPGTVAAATLGGLDGLVTGLGVGMIVDDPGSQPERLGVAAGTVAGLGVGLAAWRTLDVGPGDAALMAGSSAVLGWTGLWTMTLGHASSDDVRAGRMVGGLMAGTGIGSIGASLLAPHLEIDDDLIVDALALDAVLGGAGAGIGALASNRFDAPSWGLLGAGSLGLALGGALHRRVDIDDGDAPLLTLGGLEGTWIGAWLPYLAYDAHDVTGRRTAGGLAAGALGGLGAATLLSTGGELSAGDAALGGAGSAIGAAVFGGAALIDQDLHDRRGVGLMLGGSTAGMLVGALAAPHIEFRDHAAGAVALGGVLGGSEALLFAWAGRGSEPSEYWGATLVGAGVGTTLGMAATASPNFTATRGVAAAGFSAWGAWVGSFGGALVRKDAHEIFGGGLGGADVGFITGYALLRSEALEPRDFGWLSLFGGIGTVVGGIAGAPFATRDNLSPVFIGLGAGPVVGMAVGAIALPRLRAASNRAQHARAPEQPGHEPGVSVARLEAPVARGFSAVRDGTSGDGGVPRPAADPDEPAPSALLTSADVVRASDHRDARGRLTLARALAQAIHVEQWSPLLGALPQTPDNPGPAPFIIGVTGLWR